MVQYRIKVRAATFRSWQHWWQTQQWSFSVFLRGPQGVAEWGWPTPYLAGNDECPEQFHSGTPPTSRGNSSWTTITRFVDYCWVFPVLFLPGWSETMLAAWFLLSYLTTLVTVCAPKKGMHLWKPLRFLCQISATKVQLQLQTIGWWSGIAFQITYVCTNPALFARSL